MCKLKRRLKLWNYLAKVDRLKRQNKYFSYHSMKLVNNKCEKQIDKDLKRTLIPSMLNDKQRGQFYVALKNILTAYSNFNNKVGYVQGMNIIVSCILFNLIHNDQNQIFKYETDTFWLFTSLMEIYKIRDCYYNKMKRIFLLADSLSNKLKERLNDIYQIVNNGEVS